MICKRVWLTLVPDAVKRFDYVIPMKMTPCACQAQGVLHLLVSYRLVRLFFPRKIPHHLVSREFAETSGICNT